MLEPANPGSPGKLPIKMESVVMIVYILGNPAY